MELESSDYQLYAAIAHLHTFSRVSPCGHSIINKTFTLLNDTVSTAGFNIIWNRNLSLLMICKYTATTSWYILKQHHSISLEIWKKNY
jgi:hypothetical protein